MYSRRFVTTCSAVVAVALAASMLVFAATASAAGSLTASVGPGFTVSLMQGGKKVTSLKAGTYTIKVSDKSNIHNFHLIGAGVNKATSVSGKGTSTWKVTFKKGTYTYVCDPHASKMKGSFKVS